MPGTIIGTPRYLSPEQVLEEPSDHRRIFAAGAVLYEMMTGRAAFDGETVVKVIHAVAYEHPPGSTVHRPWPRLTAPSTRRSRSGRRTATPRRARWRTTCGPPCCSSTRHGATRSTAADHAPHRAAVSNAAARSGDRLPVLQPFGCPLDVAVGARVAPGAVQPDGRARRTRTVDLDALASKADVDAVLTGTILRSGDQLRVTAQLVRCTGRSRAVVADDKRAPWRHLPASGRAHEPDRRVARRTAHARDKQALARDVPASARAYEFYLRANQLAYQAQNWSVARDLYRQCLDDDPRTRRRGRAWRGSTGSSACTPADTAGDP